MNFKVLSTLPSFPSYQTQPSPPSRPARLVMSDVLYLPHGRKTSVLPKYLWLGGCCQPAE